MVWPGRRTIPIDRYRYEDNGRHRLTLTMTLDLEIEDYLGSVTTNKHRLKVDSTPMKTDPSAATHARGTRHAYFSFAIQRQDRQIATLSCKSSQRRTLN